MISEALAWAILFLPLASFLLIALVLRPFFPRYRRPSGYLAVLGVAAALVLSLQALGSTGGREGPLGWPSHPWLSLGDLEIEVGILMDSTTALMLVVVTGVSLLVQVYSLGYMRGDGGYQRYFAFMSLFTASMVGLVLARNVVQLYVFWELVGMCSYLLIGFWFHRPAAAAAAKKAFLVTRIGDVGFLLAILYLFLRRDAFPEGVNPLEIPQMLEALPAAAGGLAVSGLALGIFVGAAGKSAQFPLHTWLPDAMEGPTPVSALIHAATMVAAGVFLVARFFPVFEASWAVSAGVALIGAITALMAATMGLVMFDIKRVLAYSTISQLGYMMVALGVGAPDVALFHLFNHAFFKALLFLGAGSVNHATGTYDMRYMGGLRRTMPWTYVTFLLGSLSLAGVFPLSGFWSKDEVIRSAWDAGMVAIVAFLVTLLIGVLAAWYMIRYRGGLRRFVPRTYGLYVVGVLILGGVFFLLSAIWGPGEVIQSIVAEGVVPVAVFLLALVTVFLTALYMSRVVILTFHGPYRGGAMAEREGLAVQVMGQDPRLPQAARLPEDSQALSLRSTDELLPMVSRRPKESPIIMVIPLVILATLAVFSGYQSNPTISSFGVPAHWLTEFLGGPVHPINWGLALLSTGVVLAGLVVGILAFAVRLPFVPWTGRWARSLGALFTRKYYLDELYDDRIVVQGFYRWVAGWTDWFDRVVVDGVVDRVGWLGQNAGRAVAGVQTGQLQAYGLMIVVGVLAILGGFLLWG